MNDQVMKTKQSGDEMFRRIEEHNCEKETFHNYVERMVNFSEANPIAEEKCNLFS